MTRKSKFRPRGLVAFIVFGGFAVMTVTGLVLFVTPPGRVAYWTNWALLGPEKSDWAAVHIVFSLLFVLAGLIHLFFNWKPFKHYLLDKFASHLKLRAESVIGSKGIRNPRLACQLLNEPSTSLPNGSRCRTSWFAARRLSPAIALGRSDRLRSYPRLRSEPPPTTLANPDALVR
ncbi:MAG: DUF4405 domain-containing protein [Burkholderiales bacterium]|nr:DUF4405 domain-containing protein [Burkholderiales bacterium]